jgi:hypothetical protein
VTSNAKTCLLRSRVTRREGISLLETILAIAILAGAMITLGELVRIGTRAGGAARELTEAQLICESIVSAIVSGATEPESITRAVIPTNEEWLYTIWLGATEQEGLVELRVRVEQNLPAKKRPLTFTLVRWITDPGLELSEEPLDGEEEESAEEEESEEEEAEAESDQGGPATPQGPPNAGGPGLNQGPPNTAGPGRN